MFANKKGAVLGIACALPAGSIVGAASNAPSATAEMPAPPGACVLQLPKANAPGSGSPTVQCFGTPTEALNSAGISHSSPGALGSSSAADPPPAGLSVGLADANKVLAVHYNRANVPLYITGTDCGIGYADLGSWNGEITATEPRFCQKVKHYSYMNYQGPYQQANFFRTGISNSPWSTGYLNPQQ